VIPLELPGISESKDEKLLQSMGMLGKLIARFELNPDDIIEVGTIGPALISIIVTKFRRLPVIEKLLPFEIDDAMYNQYAEAVADLFLYGITGIAELKQREGDNNENRG
jgi:hypothetical protein